MTSLNNKYTNNRSMNGLISIFADSIESTNSIVNDSLIVDGQDVTTVINQVETNTTNLTGITYTPTPPTTKFMNNIDETGTIYIRDPSDPTNVYMRIYYEPSLYGFVFSEEIAGRYMNFRVKDNAGNYKLFYFSAGQLYASMGCYFDNWFNVSFGKDFTLGDNNGLSWIGSRQKYIPNSAVTSGLVFYNKGLNNNTAYYTNFTHNDLSNVETATLRMNYNNIWSKVPHTFESSLIGQSATFSTTLNVSGTSTLNTINGTSLYITGASTFNNSITADSLSVINGTNLNGNLNAISTSNFIGTTTFIGNIIANATTITPSQLSYISGTTSNIQTQLNNKLNLTGGTISGNLTVSGTTILQTAEINTSCTNYGNVYFYNDMFMQVSAKLYASGIGITQQELSYLSGVTSAIQTQLNSKLNLTGGTISGNLTVSGLSIFSNAMTVNNTITTNNNITQTGTTATTNKITQPRISADVTGNPNILKYTQIKYNSGSTTDRPVLQITDETGSQFHINFLPNSASGSYNALVNTNDRAIVAVNPTGSASALTLTTYGATGSHGIRIFHTSAIDYTTQIWANSYYFKLNSITGITASVGANSLIMNSTNTTISGPAICSNALTVSGATQLNGGVLLSTTTLLNNNILQYGSSIISQDMTGTYSGTNQLKLTNIFQNTSSTGTTTPALSIEDSFNNNGLMFLPNSGASSYNPLNLVNGQSITAKGSGVIDSANFTLTTWGTLKNGVKISTTGSANAQTELWAGYSSSIILNNATGVTLSNTASITYTDTTVQTTAYTTAKNTKLNNIGSVTIASLTASYVLVTATLYSAGSISLSAGTYILTCNGCVNLNGATTVGSIAVSYSTSSTSLSQTTNLAIIHAGNLTYNTGNQWILSTTGIVSPSVTTVYYLVVSANFGTATRANFIGTNSNFSAVRLA